jgi:magnesium-dependent phosphatase-1
MKLVAFDGDNTLWTPLSGLHLTDRTPTDPEGSPDFSFNPLPDNPLTVRRDDGALFALRPEAREVLGSLRAHGVLTAVASYNHPGPVRSALGAFGLLPLLNYVVAEWHTNKDQMLSQILVMAALDGHDISPGDALLVDDDPEGLYAVQCERMGARLAGFGKDIHGLREVLQLAKIADSGATR